MSMDYGKFKKKTHPSSNSKAKSKEFASTAPMTVLAPDPANSHDKARIGTGHIFQSGKYAGEGFILYCDHDERSKRLWFEKRHELTIISNKKFNNESGPVTVLVEDIEATSKSGLTAIGKGYFNGKKVFLQCYHDDVRAEQLWHEKSDKFLVFPDRR